MRKIVKQFDETSKNIISLFPHGFKPVMQLFSLIGQPPITVGIIACIVGFGLAKEDGFYWMSGLIGFLTIAIASLLKYILHRARPVNDYVRKMLIQTYSFPSGHAAGSLVSFGLLAIIVTDKLPNYGMYAWLLVFITCFFIGLSRVYLGAHYASDVIGGWILGGIGLLCILLMSV